MSYQPPPPTLSPPFPIFNTSTPPPPPPKPSTQQHAQPDDQYAPALPPYPPQGTLGQPTWQDYRRSGDELYLNHTPQQAEPSYRYKSMGTPVAEQQGRTQPALPDKGWVPESLLDKSKHDLEALLANPALLHALVQNPETTHPSVPASLAPLLPLLNSNTTLATHILGLLSTVTTQRAHTMAQLHSVRALEQQWKKKQAELERKLEPWGPRELHQRLGAAIAEGEAVCRGVEESFLEGQGIASEREVGEWVKRVREGRRVVALRRERKARWDEGRVGGWR